MLWYSVLDWLIVLGNISMLSYILNLLPLSLIWSSLSFLSSSSILIWFLSLLLDVVLYIYSALKELKLAWYTKLFKPYYDYKVRWTLSLYLSTSQMSFNHMSATISHTHLLSNTYVLLNTHTPFSQIHTCFSIHTHKSITPTCPPYTHTSTSQAHTNGSLHKHTHTCLLYHHTHKRFTSHFVIYIYKHIYSSFF